MKFAKRMDRFGEGGIFPTGGDEAEETGGGRRSAFGLSGEGYVRMALVQDEPELKKAIEAIDRCGILKKQMGV